MSIASADLILFLVDASRDLTQDDETLYAGIKARDVLIVLNKSDLAGKVDEAVIKDRFPGKDIIKVSALQKTGIDGLEEAIIRHVLRGGAVRTDGVMITNIRHIDALARCLQSVVGAAGGFRQGISIEFISEEIKSAVNTLDSITGRNIDSDLLDRIFTDFCIGK